MILDQMKNAAFYKGVMPAITVALEKMANYTPDDYPIGRIDVDGDNLFLLLNDYKRARLKVPFLRLTKNI